MSEQEPAPDVGRERLVFFSDAVFAIAITLLALDIRVPEIAGKVTNEGLATAILALGPRLFAYVASFAVVGLFWLAHWRRYLLIEVVDETLVLLNLVLLGFIALIPFPTSLLGAYGNLPLAVVVYAVVLSGAGLMGTATWLYASRRGLVRPGLPPDAVRRGTLRGLAVPIVMLGSLFLLPFADTVMVQLSWVLIFPLQAVLRRLAREAPAPDRAAPAPDRAVPAPDRAPGAPPAPAPAEPAPDPPRTPPGSAPG